MPNLCNISVSTQNTSVPLTQARISWDFADTLSLVTILLSFSLNLTIVILFCQNSSCRTSFNYYIVNLCLTNLAFNFVYPLDVLNERYPFHLPPLPFCVFFRYITYITPAQVNNAHLLLALNRLWAVTWPISYRQFHRTNSGFATVKVCATMWAYCSLCVLPGIVLDALEPRLPAEMYHCSSSAATQWAWQATTQILVYDIPIAITLVIYPFILYKTSQMAREKQRKVGQSRAATRTDHSRHQRTDALRRTSQRGQMEISEHQDGTQQVDQEEEQTALRNKAARGCVNINTSGNFLTLSLLIVNVACSLVPGQVFYTLLVFGKFVPEMYTVMWILYSLGPIVDALLFLTTVHTFRTALQRGCTCT
ncbi:hypothetical protein RvY_08394 [Ramazzottius varieornatus]|uniref:G-protein coupled receptors family 1 profile domain-containing protein n=1 Tax=Ramazzottius varieornatus TaxID=947166 RepID=A0A1D1V5R0_RAMVA|nr:hypothetical protein RvY_08394 [Ramazzottius varieornatus]